MTKNKEITISASSTLLLVIAFFEGLTVMGIEIVSAKMIAPFFGATIYVWTAVLAVTLCGLTAGYYFGGVFSKKKNRDKWFPFFMLIAVVLTILMPTIGNAIMQKTMYLGFKEGATYSAIVFLFPPLFFYGMIPPVLISMLSEKVEESGDKTGRVYAVSTLGGVLMAILTGYYILPSLGIRVSLVAISVVFSLFILLMMLKSNRGLVGFFVVLGVLMFSFFSVQHKEQPKTGLFNKIYAEHGLFGYINVIDYSKNNTRALFTNNISQSYVHIGTGRSQWTYVHRLACYSSFKPSGSSVFLVGLGAGNVVSELNLLGFKVNVCDIEKRMYHIAKTYFGMTEPQRVIIDDARHALNVEKDKHDIVILDISAGELQPNNIYTVESFSRIKEVLKDDGVLFVHYPTIVNNEAELALKSICKTLDEVGFKVDLINTMPREDMVSEMIIFASPSGVDLAQQNFERRDHFSDPFGFPYDNTMIMPYNYADGLILSDDKPIMDKLHFPVSQRHRIDGINVTIKGLLQEGFEMF